ncbi:MAG: hypothetical protein R3175_06270 [Marinobacter sp.]|uniref:glycine-rich domain-containing protein n=1 Tax=Marinobacter sp. TaxID=50741 RepID=UPI00299E4A2A|nr:hypothetical protein [Marinobacter sp.]MDX1755645.1 hypothetical protein [Marinobacter sp.]
MAFVAFVFVLVVTVSLAYGLYRRAAMARRERLIDAFRFPEAIAAKVAEKYPHLQAREIDQVMAGLREYFHLCNLAGPRMVAMPSQVVDVAWHEFILFTRKYQLFCKKALGRFLHHTPAEAMRSPTVAQKGIRTAWKLACQRENITPRSPQSLPLLFALDTQLNIPDGFRYELDCKQAGADGYCAGHIGCGSGCGGGCSGDSGGCGGGCGGD